MAVTRKTLFLKDVYQEGLPNVVAEDVQGMKFISYSTADVTVGAGDTLEFALIKVPAGTFIGDVWVKINTVNGGTLVASVHEGSATASSAIIHANTFDLNTTATDLEPVLATKRVFDTEKTLWIVFPNSAVVKTALEIEVGISGIVKTTWL